MEAIHIRNTKNQLNYTIGRVKRYLNNPLESRYRDVLRDVFECEIEYKRCDNCIHDDFGYCGLRHSNMTDYEITTKYCFKSFLKACEEV